MSKKGGRANTIQCMRCTKPILDEMEFIFVQCQHCNHYWHVQCEQPLSCCTSNYTSILVGVTIDDTSEIYMPNAFNTMMRFTLESFDNAIIVMPGKDIILVQALYNRAKLWIQSAPAWGVTDISGCYYNTDLYYVNRVHLPYDYIINTDCKEYLAINSRSIFHYMIVARYPVYRFITADSVDIIGAHPTVSRELILRHIDSNKIFNHNFISLHIIQKSSN